MLNTLAKNALHALHLRTDYRAEQMVYVPADGPPRNIRATCVARAGRFSRRDQTDERLDELEVTLSADEAGDSGGVAAPNENDRLYRAGRGEKVVDAYGFAEVLDQFAYGWRLLFRRHRRRSYGAGARE